MRNLVNYNTLLVKVASKMETLRLYYPMYYYAFDVMFYTGCRSGEVLELNRWQIGTNNSLILQPLKGNNAREFIAGEFPVYFYDAVLNNVPLNYGLTYSKLNYAFNYFYREYSFVIGLKKSKLHIYRHLYAKRLKDSGLADVDIKVKMGELNQASANSYIYSQVYSF